MPRGRPSSKSAQSQMVFDESCLKAMIVQGSFYEFVKAAWPHVEPAPFIDNWHIGAICEHLAAVTSGEIKKLLVNVPPGCSKPCSVDGHVLEKTKGRIKLADVVVGDEVLTHRGRFRAVEAVHEQGILPLLEITTLRGRVLRVNHEHPLLTTGGWVSANKLTLSDILAVVFKQTSCGSNTVPIEEARLLGYLVGDGCVKFACAGFTNQDLESVADFVECARTLGFDTKIKKRPGVNATTNIVNLIAGTRVYCPNHSGRQTTNRSVYCLECRHKARRLDKIKAEPQEFDSTGSGSGGGFGVCDCGEHRQPRASFCRRCEIAHLESCGLPEPTYGQGGKGDRGAVRLWLKKHDLEGKCSYDKVVPPLVMAGTDEIVAEFLAAYWACDGTIQKHKDRDGVSDISCSTVSEGLARGLQHLLTRLGIPSTLRRHESQLKTRAQGDTYVSWGLSCVTRDGHAKFLQIVGPKIRHEKRRRIENFHRWEFDKTLEPDGIRSIKEVQSGLCRCLTVEQDSSFAYEDVAVHNSLLTSVFWPMWEWAKDPTIRWFFASYDQRLSTRDSIRCRTLLETKWYKGISSKPFTLADDNNQRTYFENSFGGYRLATSVGGHGTGEHPHRVCLPWEGMIHTDRGQLPIGLVVDERLPVKVMSHNHDTGLPEWQEIEEYESSPGRVLLKVSFCGAENPIELTEEHPVYVVGKGYVAAINLIEGDEVIYAERLTASFRPLFVSKVERQARIPEKVYNVSVRRNHNYFTSGVLVHNCVDDPHRADQAESENERQSVIDWRDLTMSTRGVSVGVRWVIIMQRLHEDDLAGHVLKDGDWEHLCHDAETEILTDDGWVLFSDLHENQKVAQVDPNDLKMSFVVPSAIQVADYDGDMYEWESDSVSMAITPDHRVVYKDGNDQKSFGMMSGGWRIRPASELPKGFLIPQSAFVDVPEVSTVFFAGRDMNADDYCEFMGYYLSEGCVRRRNDRLDFRADVVLSQNEGSTCDKMRKVMDRLGFKRTESNRLRPSGLIHVQIHTRDKQLWDALAPFGKSKDKYVPGDIKRMGRRQIEIFLQAYALGDGHVSKRSGNVGYCTISRRMIDDLQELFVKIGWTGGLGYKLKQKNKYQLAQRISKGKECRIKFWGLCREKNKRIFTYTGKVYCVSVPTGAVMCRRRGKPFVSGNCLPMRYEKGRMKTTCIGFNDPRKKDGELLSPRQFNEETVQTLEKRLGPYGSAGQLQQRPQPKGGGLFKDEYFATGRVKSAPYDANRVIYWDLAHCLVAGTLVDTMKGKKPIEKVREGEFVLTRRGYKRVAWSGVSGKVATTELVSVSFSNGKTLIGTSHHRVWTTNRGWVPLGQLSIRDSALTYERSEWQTKETQIWKWLCSMGCVTPVNQVDAISGSIDGISHSKSIRMNHYIEQYGCFIMDPFQTEWKSITKTKTGATTKSVILNALLSKSIEENTGTRWPEPEYNYKNQSIVVRREGKKDQKSAKSSTSNTAVRSKSGGQKYLLRPISVVSAENYLSPGTIPHRRPAVLHADTNLVNVYDLTVEDVPEFFANGVLVHNSASKAACRTVGTVVHEKDGEYYIGPVWTGQWDPYERDNKILAAAQYGRDRWGPHHEPTIVIEEEPIAGKDLCRAIIRKLVGFKARSDRVRKSKLERADSYASQCAAGAVHLVEDGTWDIVNWVKEHSAFPNGSFLDRVDSAGGGFNWLANNRRSMQVGRFKILKNYNDPKKKKVLRFMFGTTELLSRIIIEERAILVVIRNPGHLPALVSEHHPAFTNLLGSVDFEFIHREPGDMQDRWDQPLDEYGGVLPEHAVMRPDQGKQFWVNVLKQRDQMLPAEVVVVVDDEDGDRAKSVAYAAADAMGFKRSDSVFDMAEPEWMGKEEPAPCLHVYKQTKALRNAVVG